MQLSNLLLHKHDRKQLDAVITSGVQSVLLTADNGFGKQTIATALSSELIEHKVERLLLVEPLESSITIDQIRKLKSFFTLKTLGNNDKRVAILQNADTMTTEAQNSLLKLLEEPPRNCYVILTSSHPGLLLGTISSRVQTMRLRSPKIEEVQSYFVGKGCPSMEVDKAISMTNGLVGVTASILYKENGSFVESLQKAKEILGQKQLERLRNIETLSKDKYSVLALLDALKTVAHAATRKSPTSSSLWRKVLHGCLEAEQQLSHNANTKLVLTNLFLSL